MTAEGMRVALSRRGFLAGASLLPLLGIVPGLLESARAAADAPYRFFTSHQAAVLDAATRRLVPGPDDDPAETGHPGAHEAQVVRFLDTMLSAFDSSPPTVFAGGPWSDRQATGPDFLATFLELDAVQAAAWRQRIAGLRQDYAAGVTSLDAAAGGDFTTASTSDQDQILTDAGDFTALLFSHTIEGMYSIPEYGGNAGRVGWIEIGYPGDSQPRGYTAAELAEQQVSVLDPTGIVGQALAALPQLAPTLPAGGPHRVG